MGLKPSHAIVARLLYAALFVVFIPAFLWWWSVAAAEAVRLPVLVLPVGGFLIAAIGLSMMVAGSIALWVHARGLPMSPFPPQRYVSNGIYRFIAHPIYTGFVLVCFGVALATGSRSGLWLVAPTVALACTALVLGHERIEMRRRFSADELTRPVIALPQEGPEKPTTWESISILLLVLVPWTIVYEAVVMLGVPPDAIIGYLPFEYNWPVRQWTEAIYGSAYIIVPASAFVARTRSALRHFALTGLIATAAVTLIYLTVPVVAPPRAFEPTTLLGRALMLERVMAHTVAAFPAFHALWAFIAAEAWGSRSRRFKVVAWIWAAGLTVSCVTTGMHALVDLVAAMLAYLILRRYRELWHKAVRGAERVANSWRSWRIGRVRVINYGIYAAVAAFVGFVIAVVFGGERVFNQLVVVHLMGLAGAGLWAQTLEGSGKLSRPFGYYGSVIGAVGGAVIVGALYGDTLLLLSALALEAPWVQMIGRLRCLVQGCCHGSRTAEWNGIRYWDARSRVCALGELEGEPLHPTPLYSIVSNFIIGVFLLRLAWLGTELSLICGLYLILSGIARFVEEAYRGEPQTPVVGGLRLYQWFAVTAVVLGALLTTLVSGSGSAPVLWFDWRIVAVGVCLGIVTGFAMGVDFPESSRRFARLAPP